MKKILAVLFVLTVATMVSCSKNPESEARALILDMTKITESAAEKIGKAATAKEAGDELLAYAESMNKLAGRGKELEKKYPDMKVENNEKFKTEEEALVKAMSSFAKALEGAMLKYVDSEELKDAMMKMSEMIKN